MNREETIAIADEIGIKHPADPKTQVNTVMTTDFMLTIKENDQIKSVSRTIKPSSELNKRRVVEKFEIERVYWERKGVDYI